MLVSRMSEDGKTIKVCTAQQQKPMDRAYTRLRSTKNSDMLHLS